MRILLVFLSVLIFASCARNNSVVSNGLIQKRKYRSGFFIKSSNKNRSTEKTRAAAKNPSESEVKKQSLATGPASKETVQPSTSEVEEPKIAEVSTLDIEKTAKKRGFVTNETLNQSSDEQTTSMVPPTTDKYTLGPMPTTSFPFGPANRISYPTWLYTAMALFFTALFIAGLIILWLGTWWELGLIFILAGILGLPSTVISVVRMIRNGAESNFHLIGTIIACSLWGVLLIALILALTNVI